MVAKSIWHGMKPGLKPERLSVFAGGFLGSAGFRPSKVGGDFGCPLNQPEMRPLKTHKTSLSL